MLGLIYNLLMSLDWFEDQVRGVGGYDNLPGEILHHNDIFV